MGLDKIASIVFILGKKIRAPLNIRAFTVK